MGETLKVGDYVVETPLIEKRSVSSDPEKDTGYVAIFKIPTAPKDAIRSIAGELRTVFLFIQKNNGFGLCSDVNCL